jgi:hypothetical protein
VEAAGRQCLESPGERGDDDELKFKRVAQALHLAAELVALLLPLSVIRGLLCAA